MIDRKKQYVLFICLSLFLITMYSCISVQPDKSPDLMRTREIQPRRRDVYHTVAPGETIWRLAKMYDVKERDILRANRLRKSDGLKMGQSVKIPRASAIKPFVPLIPTSKWKYIIIHHSATDEGNSLYFHKAHIKRGFDRGVGYHFVINNGTKDKKDGQIEVTPRWIKIQDGAHCKSDDMNKEGIGICLVGNFSQENVSKKQMESLVYLVNKLRKYYNIPRKKIMGHSHVRGASTECPGTKFPWDKFYKKLSEN